MNLLPSTGPFRPDQKEYLQGFLAGVSQRDGYGVFAGHTAHGEVTSDASQAGPNLAEPREEAVHGTPVSDLCKEELWKHQEDSLEIWGRMLEHAADDRFPDPEQTFRFRYHGLFYVAPAQNSFMLRCRIPGGALDSYQLRGLADMADTWGGGYADITTRANFQIREIAPRDITNVLIRLQELGLTSRGSGVDNVRNVTCSPTAGVDRAELLDTLPCAKGIHHYILNNRDLYGLPRKFNIAFDGGGAISTVAETNDLGFVAVRVGEGKAVEPGIYFRIELCGITGHRQFASDSGLLIEPDEAIAVAAAMLRVFAEHGDRTNRKRARLKYLVDKWGVEKFIGETQKKLAFPLIRLPREECEPRPAVIPHGHIGIYPQKQEGLNYVGVCITVGRMTVEQVRRIADLADRCGSGRIRLTVWQNLVITDVSDAKLDEVKAELVAMGFHWTTTSISGGLVACTGNTGCKWAAANTKAQSVELACYLESRLELDRPINIHFTGCPNSCAQHYMGDIGLQGVTVTKDGEKVEGYNIVMGGGFGEQQAVAKDMYKAVAYADIPPLIERVLRVYLEKREVAEDFASFTRRHEQTALLEMFSS